MVRVSYVGIAKAEAGRAFEALRAHVLAIRRMQAQCAPQGAEDVALEMIVDGLESAAYHFTRRARFYDDTRLAREPGRGGCPGLGERSAAVAAFEALRPLWGALREMQGRCRPFGRDYLALEIPKHTLTSAAYHFTRIESFFGATAMGPAVSKDP